MFLKKSFWSDIPGVTTCYLYIYVDVSTKLKILETVTLLIVYFFRSLAEACSDGDVGTVRKLLTEGRSVHETTEEGESLLSLACSAGYYELAQVYII